MTFSSQKLCILSFTSSIGWKSNSTAMKWVFEGLHIDTIGLQIWSSSRCLECFLILIAIITKCSNFDLRLWVFLVFCFCWFFLDRPCGVPPPPGVRLNSPVCSVYLIWSLSIGGCKAYMPPIVRGHISLISPLCPKVTKWHVLMLYQP